MKLLKYFLFACALMAVIQNPAFSSDGWLTSLDDGLNQAKTEKKLVLVDFTADWCGWCKKLQADVFAKDEFKDYAGKNLILVSVDADKNQELVAKYNVSGFPTIVLLDAEGNIKDTLVGYKPLKEFMDALPKDETPVKP